MHKTSRLFLHFVFLSLLLSTLTTCRKISGEVLVKATVQDSATGLAIPNAKVFLSQQENNTCLFCSNFPVVIDSFTTDNSGFVRFEFYSKKGYNYKVGAGAPNYYTTGELSVKPGRNKVTITPIPYGWVKAHVKNVSPVDDMDEFSIGSSGPIYGKNVDTSLVIGPYRGGEINKISWSSFKGGVSKRETLELNIKGHDTIEITVEY